MLDAGLRSCDDVFVADVRAVRREAGAERNDMLLATCLKAQAGS